VHGARLPGGLAAAENRAGGGAAGAGARQRLPTQRPGHHGDRPAKPSTPTCRQGGESGGPQPATGRGRVVFTLPGEAGGGGANTGPNALHGGLSSSLQGSGGDRWPPRPGRRRHPGRGTAPPAAPPPSAPGRRTPRPSSAGPRRRQEGRGRRQCRPGPLHLNNKSLPLHRVREPINKKTSRNFLGRLF
jgi:hypothetical protein